MTILRQTVAQIMDVPPLDFEAPGPFRYADAGKLLAVLERGGFESLEVTDWQGSFPIGGGLPPAEAATFVLAAFSSFNELLAAADDDAANGARLLLTTRVSEHQSQGVVRLDPSVHIAAAWRLRTTIRLLTATDFAKEETLYMP